MKSTSICILLFALAAANAVSTVESQLVGSFPYPYTFADQFTLSQLNQDAAAREAFKVLVAKQEAFFHTDGVGVDLEFGVTFDGIDIDPITGLPLPSKLHNFSASSKEAIHVSMAAVALSPHATGTNGALATTFFSASAESSDPKVIRAHIVDVMKRKLDTYERFNANFPGFGGFLPWFHTDINTGLGPQGEHWADAVPALDNGELIWGMYALANALRDAGEPALATRYQNYLSMMTTNLKMMFYQPDKHAYAAEVHIYNVSAQPFSGNYKTNDPNYNLNDPYEGELFTWWCDLFCDWTQDAAGRDAIWVAKRAKLVAIEADIKTSTPVTVQQGNWYSAHELWKMLEMPYLSVPITRGLFINGEVARSWLMLEAKSNGMRASVNGVAAECHGLSYESACGIQELASQEVNCVRVVTPYATFPIIMIDESIGLPWYAATVNGSRGQGPLGSTEALNVDGTDISPMVTWDSKITTLLSMVGGVAPLNEFAMRNTVDKNSGNNKSMFDRFNTIVTREHEMAFPSLSGAGTPLVLPAGCIPRTSNFALPDADTKN